jgi:CIC family chloride channel protein
VIEAIAVRGGTIRPRVAVAKSVASAITIGSGGSVGREGPVVQIGAALGSVLGGNLGLSREQRRNLVGCGAAAGIAATFNAPIAAAFFALEVILGNFALTTFGPIVLASVVATAVSRARFGDAPAFQVPEYELVSWWELTTYVGLGLLCGVAACAFIWILYRCEDLAERSPVPKLLRPAVGGLLLGVLLLGLPQLYGSGFTTIEEILHGRATWSLALMLIGAKVLGTSITLASGGSGGVFSPSLFIGAVTGYAGGHLIGLLAPFPTASSAAYALVGMGALLGGATHAPITSILMLFELTGDYAIILPMMLATTVSTVTARAVMRDSIYSMKLRRKGLRLLGGREETVMTTFRVREVMRPDVPTVAANTPLPDVVGRFLGAPITALYVVDGQQRLEGGISLHDIKELLPERSLDELVVARDLMVSNVPTVLADDRLGDCMQRFAETGSDSLPVLSDPRTRRPVGLITRHDLVDLYDTEILRREMLGTVAASDIQTRPAALPAGHRLRSVPVPAVWVAKTLRELDLRQFTGVTVISIQETHAPLRAHTPDPDRPLQSGDILVVLGSSDASAALDALIEKTTLTSKA